MSFTGSRSTLWQPTSFWDGRPAQPGAVHALVFEVPGGGDGADTSSPPPQRMPSQPGSHKLEALSALAHRSARKLWCAAAAPPPPPPQLIAEMLLCSL